MSPAQRDDGRPAHRRSRPERASTSGRGRERLVVRWIGAAKRRGSKRVEAASIEVPSAHIIRLSWVDTFGRPSPSLSTCTGGYTADVSIGMAGR